MHNEEFLSIVIITCNRKDELKKTLQSCMNMANMPVEIIVIDNGSTDGTRELLESMPDTENCVICPYFSQMNLGVSGGRNKGFELANSDIVFFIDDDAVFDESHSKTLDVAYQYMMGHQYVGALAFDIFDLKEHGKLIDSFKDNDPKQKEMLSYVGACHMLRKTNDRQYLYPPKLMYGAEERYASILYFDMGLKVEYFPDIKVLHNPSTKTRMSKIHTHRNVMINQYVIKKLLMPTKYHLKINAYFLIRQLKTEKFNLIQIIRNFKEAYKRIQENAIARKSIKEETVTQICDHYGELVII